MDNRGVVPFALAAPEDFFPAAVARQQSIVQVVSNRLSDDDLTWVSENRDFAEAERYRQKDDVDHALVASSVVSDERIKIEALFEGADPVLAAEKYLDAYQIHMKCLHELFTEAATRPTAALDWEFWRRVMTLADADNAHAMYLSSHNWPFSVFNALIDEMHDTAGDEDLLRHLLVAGVQDVRTNVYTLFGSEYRGMRRAEFVRAVRVTTDWFRPNGVMPLFAFKAATETTAATVRADSAALREDFSQAVRTVMDRNPPSVARRFMKVARAYQRLYAARASYDTYEYFGFYAFVRHTSIRDATQAIARSSPDTAARFGYAASTYQFSTITDLFDTPITG